MKVDVAIVGAGPSGLSAARFLSRRGLSVAVVDGAPFAGGAARSEEIEGHVLDVGPNGWLDDEPALEQLGLDLPLLPAAAPAAERWVAAEGALQPVPMSPPALLRSRLLSLGSKLRLLLDLLLPRGPVDETESVADFISRRLGPGLIDRLVAPGLNGIYGAPPELLGMQAAFPRMAQAEQAHRSLILGLLRAPARRRPVLTSTARGVGAWTAALAAPLGQRLLLSQPVRAIERRSARWRALCSDGYVEADALCLSCPAWAQRPLLADVDPSRAALLDQIEPIPLTVLSLSLPLDAWARSPSGFGALQARGEPDPAVLGAIFVHNIFPPHAPEGRALLRVMIGGLEQPEAAAAPQAELEARALAALDRWFGPRKAAPALARLYRHPRALPLYSRSLPALTRRLKSMDPHLPGLFLGGHHLDGPGLKDCVRQGARLAEEISAWLGR